MIEVAAQVESAVRAIADGRVVIVVDARDREDEGDFVCAADRVDADVVRFMTREGGGLFCMPIPRARAQELELEPMVEHPTSRMETPFTIPVDHRSCRTGISPAERAATVAAVMDPASRPTDFVVPGHLFVLVAEDGGVLRRAGHTEATIDLVRMAGLAPGGVLCEICSPHGTEMADAAELHELSERFDLPIVSIEDLIRYRRMKEQIVHRTETRRVDAAAWPGLARRMRYRVDGDGTAPVALVLGEPARERAPLVRVHAGDLEANVLERMAGAVDDPIGSALRRIGDAGAGALILLPRPAGEPADERDHMIGLGVLRDLGIESLRLLTDHPKDPSSFVYAGMGISIVEQIPLSSSE